MPEQERDAAGLLVPPTLVSEDDIAALEADLEGREVVPQEEPQEEIPVETVDDEAADAVVYGDAEGAEDEQASAEGPLPAAIATTNE